MCSVKQQKKSQNSDTFFLLESISQNAFCIDGKVKMWLFIALNWELFTIAYNILHAACWTEICDD